MSVKVHENNKVTDRLTVKCYEVDGTKRLKPVAFMDMAQEMAYEAAGAMHFGYDDLIDKKMAWVLSRFHFQFLDAPHWRDELDIQTWHRGAAGPFFIRDFKVFDSNGKLRIAGTSSWVVMDVESRRMVRPDEVLPSDNTICDDVAIDTPASKVMMPRGVEPELVGTHKVGYSDIDLLGHTNNARYVSWAMDCIDSPEIDSPSDLEAGAVSDIEITFHHEARLGDEISLYRVVSEDGAVTVEGRAEGSQIFCARFR